MASNKAATATFIAAFAMIFAVEVSVAQETIGNSDGGDDAVRHYKVNGFDFEMEKGREACYIACYNNVFATNSSPFTAEKRCHKKCSSSAGGSLVSASSARANCRELTEVRLRSGKTMAEPPVAPPTKKCPATAKLPEKRQDDRSRKSDQKTIGATAKGSASILEKSKKKVNRKLAMDVPITTEDDQIKVIIGRENLISEEKIESEPPVVPIEQRDHTEENQEDNLSELRRDEREEGEWNNLEAALEMLSEIGHLKSQMLKEEYEMMSAEIREFARNFAKENNGVGAVENPNEALKKGIFTIANEFLRKTKLNDEQRSKEVETSIESTESGSSDWQEGFSVEILEEMKGLCDVYAKARGGFKSKGETDQMILEIIREMKNNSLTNLKGKIVQEELVEDHQTQMEELDQKEQAKEVTFLLSPKENQHDLKDGNHGQVYSEAELQNLKGSPPVCGNAPMNNKTNPDDRMNENESKTKGMPSFGTSALEGKNRQTEILHGNQNKGGNGPMPGPIPAAGIGRERGRSQTKEGPQSRNQSRNHKGGQTPQRDQVPKPNQQGKGPGGRQTPKRSGQHENFNRGLTRNAGQGQAWGPPVNNAGGFLGRTGAYEAGESSFKYHEGGGRGWRGGGRGNAGYSGRGRRGGYGYGGVNHEAVIKEYEREGAEICRRENIDPGGEEKNEGKREEGEMVDQSGGEGEDGKLERKRAMEDEIKKSLFKAHVSPVKGQPRAQSFWGGTPQL
nr:hypothetical protein Iba_chr10fCG12050 [Ipomoea batatas]